MFVQKADIENGEIKFNKLGKIKPDDLEPGIADVHYIHEQLTASQIWTVTHNLNKRPSVSSLDSSGNVVYGHIEHISENELQIEFKFAFAGVAVCN